MNRLLRENAKLRELAGFDRVTTCAQGYRFIQAKNYFYSDGDGRDSEPIPDEAPAVQTAATTRSDAIMNGVDNAFMWAVRLNSTVDTDRRGCSASLITDEWLMTAAHCITDEDGDNEIRNFHVWTETADGRQSECITARLRIPETGIPTDDIGPCDGLGSLGSVDVEFSVRIHPDYSGDGDDEDDLALLRLSGGWPNYRGPYPLFARGGYSEDDWVSVAGYGPTNCDGTGSNNRTRASFQITDVDSRDIELNMRPEFALCSGDSGSPGYILVNGAPLIVGVASTVMPSRLFFSNALRECSGKRVCAKDSSVGQLTRLWDAKESWIEQQLGYQCYESGGIADCNRPSRPPRPAPPRPPTEPPDFVCGGTGGEPLRICDPRLEP